MVLREKNEEKPKVMRISRHRFSVQVMIDPKPPENV
jgi:hypothetical protein